MKSMWITVLLGAVLFGSGCRDKTPKIELSPNKYAVSAMILELSGKSRETLEADTSEENVNKLAGRKSSRVARIPTLYLKEGESKEFDNRISHPFLIVPPANDAPGQYGSITDGEYLKVTLTVMPSGNACLGLIVNSPNLIGWQEMKGPGNHTLKQPIRSFLNVHTTISPPWGKWRIAGTNRDRVMLVRADLPTMPM
jgi:hypothetical protein